MVATPATVEVSTDIAAQASDVWAMVSDLTRMGEWSPENEGCRWIKGATGPVAGAKFTGSNRRGAKSWSTTGTVIESDPGRVFSFRVTAGPLKVALWRYTFDETATGCRVTESWFDERGWLVAAMGKPVSGVADRISHNRAGMEQTLAALKASAESTL